MNLGNKLVKKKVDSMKQLDRIELQNRVIIQQNALPSGDMFGIVGFISLISAIGYSYIIPYLASYGIETYYHTRALTDILVVSGIGFLFYFLVLILRISMKNKFHKENEDFIEGHSN